jgi:hypothetical protein
MPSPDASCTVLLDAALVESGRQRPDRAEFHVPVRATNYRQLEKLGVLVDASNRTGAQQRYWCRHELPALHGGVERSGLFDSTRVADTRSAHDFRRT